MSDEILIEILSELKTLGQRTENVESQMAGMRTEIFGIKSEISGMNTEISGLKYEVTGMKSDISELKSDVTGMKSDISELKSDVTGMKSDISELKSNQQQIIQAVLETNNIVKNIESSHHAFKRTTSSVLNTHEYSIDILNREQLKIKAEVESLKNR